MSPRLTIFDRRREGDTAARDRDRAIEERALEHAAAGLPWLAAIAQASRDLEADGALDVATGLLHRPRGRPPGVPGRITLTAGLTSPGPPIFRHAEGPPAPPTGGFDLSDVGSGEPLPSPRLAQAPAGAG